MSYNSKHYFPRQRNGNPWKEVLKTCILIRLVHTLENNSKNVFC